MTDAARHQALKERLVDLAIDALPPAEAREVEAHAAGCAACRAELASLRGVKEQVASLPPLEAPERGAAILMAAARQAADAARARRRPGLPAWLWGAALGGVGVAAVAVVAVRLTTGSPGPLDGAREPGATQGAPAELARPQSAQDALGPASPPALGQVEAKREAAPAPAALVPASPPRPAEADAKAVASTDAGRTELRAAPARKRERQAEEAVRRDGLDAAPVPAVAAAPPPVPAAEQEAGPGRGTIGFTASGGAPPEPEQALSKAARRTANAGAPAAAPARLAASREEPGRALADAAPALEAAAPGALAERNEAPAGSAPPGLRPETRTDSTCAAERRRTLWRDGAGAVVRRLRTGRHQGAPVLLDEAFGPDGRIVSARVEAGGRVSVFGRAALEAAAFVPMPGLRVAATSAEAERDPPACDAWPR